MFRYTLKVSKVYFMKYVDRCFVIKKITKSYWLYRVVSEAYRIKGDKMDIVGCNGHFFLFILFLGGILTLCNVL